MMSMVMTHVWQEQGLGVAPFQVITIISVPSPAICEANPNAYNNAMSEAAQSARGFGVHLCSCDACGQSLVNNVIIRDANGHHFVVGMDCAMKTHDTEIITQVELLDRRRQKKLREERRETERQEREARIEANLQAQRERNGGLTDWQLAEKQRNEAARLQAIECTRENTWLIEVLSKAYRGEFVSSILDSLQQKPLREAFYGRAARIVADIYARTKGGRRGSKKYDAAYAEFESRYGEF